MLHNSERNTVLPSWPPGEKWPEFESDDYTSALLVRSRCLCLKIRFGSVDSRFENRNRDADSAPRTTPDGVL